MSVFHRTLLLLAAGGAAGVCYVLAEQLGPGYPWIMSVLIAICVAAVVYMMSGATDAYLASRPELVAKGAHYRATPILLTAVVFGLSALAVIVTLPW